MKLLYKQPSKIKSTRELFFLILSCSGGAGHIRAAEALPILIVDPIPSQENRNVDMMLEHGAGWKALNIANLSYQLQRILELHRCSQIHAHRLII